MNLGIDADILFSRTRVADAEMLVNVLDGVARLQSDWRIFLFYPARTECPPMPAADVRTCDERLRHHSNIYLSPLSSAADADTWRHVRLPLAIRANDIHVACLPWREGLQTLPIPTVVHAPLAAFGWRHAGGRSGASHAAGLSNSTWIAPSSFVAERLTMDAGIPRERIAVISPTAHSVGDAPQALPLFGRLRNPFILHVAENATEANSGRLIRAMARLPRGEIDKVSWLFVGEVCDELGRVVEESRLRAMFGDVRVLPLDHWPMLRTCIAHAAGIVHLPMHDRTGQIPLTALRFGGPTLLTEELRATLLPTSEQSLVCDGADPESIARHLSPLIAAARGTGGCATRSRVAQEPSFAAYCRQLVQVFQAARRTPLRTAQRVHAPQTKCHFLGHDPAFR
ncbi:MAG: hypothetical protein AB7N71_11210 [Phycisphaerae bacterium]